MPTYKYILCRYWLINSKTFEIQKLQNSRVSFIWNAETRQPRFTCFMHKIPCKAFLVSILVSASHALKVCYAHTHNDSVLKEMSHQGVVTELSQLTNSLIFKKGLRSLIDAFGRVYWFSTILTGQLHYIDATTQRKCAILCPQKHSTMWKL